MKGSVPLKKTMRNVSAMSDMRKAWEPEPCTTLTMRDHTGRTRPSTPIAKATTERKMNAAVSGLPAWIMAIDSASSDLPWRSGGRVQFSFQRREQVEVGPPSPGRDVIERGRAHGRVADRGLEHVRLIQDARQHRECLPKNDVRVRSVG